MTGKATKAVLLLSIHAEAGASESSLVTISPKMQLLRQGYSHKPYRQAVSRYIMHIMK